MPHCGGALYFEPGQRAMTVSDEQVVRERLDLEMLERPHLWTQSVKGMPALMLKRRDPGRSGYRWSGPCVRWAADQFVVSAHDWDNNGEVETLTYASPEAVLADGWIVD